MIFQCGCDSEVMDYKTLGNWYETISKTHNSQDQTRPRFWCLYIFSHLISGIQCNDKGRGALTFASFAFIFYTFNSVITSHLIEWGCEHTKMLRNNKENLFSSWNSLAMLIHAVCYLVCHWGYLSFLFICFALIVLLTKTNSRHEGGCKTIRHNTSVCGNWASE